MDIAEMILRGKADLDDVHEAGKAEGVKSEYDRFWDEYQTNGNRRNYSSAFSGLAWNDNTYNPKYPIIVTNIATMLFSNATMITDTKVPITIDSANQTSVFNGMTRLKTIPSIKVTSKVTFSAWFNNCTELERIIFTEDSVIGQSGLDLSMATKLDEDSITSVINALSTTTTGKSVTLSKTAVNKVFTTDEWKALTDTRTNWTISLV